MKIYIVYGETGECEDRRDWIAKAFKTKRKANSYWNKLDYWLKENKINWRGLYARNKYFDSEFKNSLINPFDPNFEFDYTGTSYYIVEVKVDED